VAADRYLIKIALRRFSKPLPTRLALTDQTSLRPALIRVTLLRQCHRNKLHLGRVALRLFGFQLNASIFLENLTPSKNTEVVRVVRKMK
jgi:hypothetical protein